MSAGSLRKSWLPERNELTHVVVATIATVASLLIARLFRMPEYYWAPITTIVVMQSTLGAAWTISKQRFIGTAIGAATGAFLATCFGTNVVVFGAGILVSGLICASLHLERNAFRYTGITLAIILLITRPQAPWIVAVHRFAEISIGIAVGLAITAIFPEDQPAKA